MKESVDKSPSVFRLTALVERHMNNIMYRFAVAWLYLVHFDIFVWYGPK